MTRHVTCDIENITIKSKAKREENKRKEKEKEKKRPNQLRPDLLRPNPLRPDPLRPDARPGQAAVASAFAPALQTLPRAPGEGAEPSGATQSLRG